MSNKQPPRPAGTPPQEGNVHPKDGAQNSPPLEGWQAKPDGVVPKLRFPEFREMGEWKNKRLGELFSDRQESGLSDLPLLSLMDKEGIVPQENSNRKNNSNSDKSKYLRVVPGDIAYNTMRMWEGRSALVGLEGLVSPAYTVCKPGVDAHSLFFSYYFKTPQLIEQFRRYSQGLVKDTLNLKYPAFAKIWAPAPDPAEQQKIADCLASLDVLITLEAQKLDTLKSHKKGLMQQLFPAEGETLPQLRFAEFRDAGEWEVRNLGRIAKNLDNRRVPITSSERIAGKIPYYGASGVVDYVKGFIFDEDLLCISEDGANLVARTYAIAFPISGKTWVNNHAHVLRFENPCTQKFVEVYLNFIKLDDFITGMAQPKLNKAMLDSIPIPWPTVPEQQRIADCLTSLDDLITVQTQKLAAFKTHKKGLMQGLFPSSGGVDSEAGRGGDYAEATTPRLRRTPPREGN